MHNTVGATKKLFKISTWQILSFYQYKMTDLKWCLNISFVKFQGEKVSYEKAMNDVYMFSFLR